MAEDFITPPNTLTPEQQAASQQQANQESSLAWYKANVDPTYGTQQTTAEQAQLQNLTYRAINNPSELSASERSYLSNMVVSPTRGIISQQQDAANELAKQQAAFSQPRTDTRDTSSPAYQAIIAQYAAQHPGWTEKPVQYEKSAAGIAAELAVSAGATGAVGDLARAEGYTGPLYAQSSTTRSNVLLTESTPTSAINMESYYGISTVPTRDYSSGLYTDRSILDSGQTVTTFAPIDRITQVELLGTKILMGEDTGEIGVYQKPAGHSLYNIVSSGSRGAVQSGMYTIGQAETPFVVKQWDIGSYTGQVGSKGYSRLGAEAYGGYVMPLDNRLLGNAQLSTYENVFNLANYVNPQGVNLNKVEAPGVDMPWAIGANAPAIQYVDSKGIVEGSGVMFLGIAPTSPVQQQSVIESAVARNSEIEGLPTPFVSTAGTTSAVSEEWYRSIPVIGAAIPEGIFRKTSEIDVPIYRSFAEAVAPTIITTQGIPYTLSRSEYESKQPGVEYSRTFIDTQGKAVESMTFPVGSPTSVVNAKGETEVTQMYQKVDYANYATITPQTQRVGESALMGSIGSFFAPVTTKYEQAKSMVQSYLPESGMMEEYAKTAQITNVFAGPSVLAGYGANYLSEQIGGKDSAYSQLVKSQSQFAYEIAPGSLAGQYTQFKEEPFMSVTSYALMGLPFGAAVRGIEAVYTPIRAMAGAGKTGAALDVVAKYTPGVLGALYAGDIGYRATEGGTTLTGAVGRAKAITFQEATPMMFGAGVGYRTPEIVKGAYESLVSAPGVVREKVGDVYYSWQQSRAGIENIGVGGGKARPYSDIFETTSEPFTGMETEHLTFYKPQPESGVGTPIEPISPSTIWKSQTTEITESKMLSGYTRLYRGETLESFNSKIASNILGVRTSSPGVWFTNSKEYANVYKQMRQVVPKKAEAVISYIDIPSSVDISRFYSHTGYKPGYKEYVIPTEIANKRLLLEDVPTSGDFPQTARFDIPSTSYYASDAERYAYMESFFGGETLLLPQTTSTAVRAYPHQPINIREYRESGFIIKPGEVTLSQKQRFTGDIVRDTTSSIKYDISKLEEPITDIEAWSEAKNVAVTAKTTQISTIDPITGQFGAYVTKTFDLKPSPKETPKGYLPEEYGYSMDIYNLPVRAERIGVGAEKPLPQIDAISKAVFGESRGVSKVSVEAQRISGSYGTVSYGVKLPGESTFGFAKDVKDINRVFSDLTTSQKPLDIDIGLYETAPTKATARAKARAERESTSIESIQQPKVIDLTKPYKGKSSKAYEGGLVIEGKEHELSPFEKLTDIKSKVLSDIQPNVARPEFYPKYPKYTTEKSQAKAMDAASKAQAKTITRNKQRFAEMEIPEGKPSLYDPFAESRGVLSDFAEHGFVSAKQTQASSKRAMESAKEFQKQTISRNEELFKGLATRQKTKPSEPISMVDTSELYLFSGAMFRSARAASGYTTPLSISPYEREREYEPVYANSRKSEDIISSITGVVSRERQEREQSPFYDISRDIRTRTDNIIDRGSRTDRENRRDILSNLGSRQAEDTRRDVATIRDTIFDQITTTTDIFNPPLPPEPTKYKFPPPPTLPLGGLGYYGGWGGGIGPSWRTSKYNYMNPVVDIEYLTSLSGSYGSSKRHGSILNAFKR